MLSENRMLETYIWAKEEELTVEEKHKMKSFIMFIPFTKC
jgi:hypothetical protein